MSIKNSVANENTSMLAPPPREICARMAKEDFRSINENSVSAFVNTYQQKKEEKTVSKTCSVLKMKPKILPAIFLFGFKDILFSFHLYFHRFCEKLHKYLLVQK